MSPHFEGSAGLIRCSPFLSGHSSHQHIITQGRQTPIWHPRISHKQKFSLWAEKSFFQRERKFKRCWFFKHFKSCSSISVGPSFAKWKPLTHLRWLQSFTSLLREILAWDAGGQWFTSRQLLVRLISPVVRCVSSKLSAFLRKLKW